VTTSKIGRFFREIGRPVTPEGQLPARPSAEEMRHFQEIAKRYGFWSATAEENTEVGLCLPM
jgi:hypothetical protein